MQEAPLPTRTQRQLCSRSFWPGMLRHQRPLQHAPACSTAATLLKRHACPFQGHHTTWPAAASAASTTWHHQAVSRQQPARAARWTCNSVGPKSSSCTSPASPCLHRGCISRSVMSHVCAASAAASGPGDWSCSEGSHPAHHSPGVPSLGGGAAPAPWHVQAWGAVLVALAPVLRFVALYRDILQRGVVTLAMLAVFRAGLFIPLPGVDFSLLPAPPVFSEGERLVRALYGQAHALPASIFELGISPFINASILITMVLALPQQLVPTSGPLHRLREARKEGRAGQAYITSIINYLALAFAVYWALVKAVELQPYAVTGGPAFLPLTAITLIAGSTIIQHCASIISSSGIGNGSSLIICCGIITEYAEALHNVMSRLEAGAVTVGVLLALGSTYLLLALAAVYISRTELRLPVMQYNRSSTDPTLLDSVDDTGARSIYDFPSARRAAELRMTRRIARADYFPIPINNSGMMSMILAGALWWFMIPAGAELLGLTAMHAALVSLQRSWLGLLVYGLLVFAVEFLPLGGINPKDVAEYFNAMNVGIKGVVPGEPTEKHVQAQLLRCKFWGGLALGCLAMVAHVFDAACMQALGASLSATSLLIIVGTVLQSSRQVESLLEGPKLGQQLEKEQTLIQSLTSL